MSADKGFEALKALHEKARLLSEGGTSAVLLPGFRFRSRQKDRQMDLLLYPAAHSGYATRLFFSEKLAECSGNWNRFRVADREWWAISWKDVPANLPWPAMLCAHLRAVA